MRDELMNNKAPGADQIKTVIVKLLYMYNRLLLGTGFPAEWREAKVVLIPKPGEEDYLKANSHRPIVFTEGRSIIYDVRRLLRTVWRAVHGWCMLLLCDVKNIFNTAVGRDQENKGVVVFVRYFRKIFVQLRVCPQFWQGGTEHGPQDSMLRSLLWNVMYDGILRVGYQEGLMVVTYADDRALMVRDKKLEKAIGKAG